MKASYLCLKQWKDHPLRPIAPKYLFKKAGNKKGKSSYEEIPLCHIVPNHRTFIDDYLKIVEFIEWLKDFYPGKAAFLKRK